MSGMISLHDASAKSDFAVRDFLRKWEAEGLPIYYWHDTTSVVVWEFQSITDDPACNPFSSTAGLGSSMPPTFSAWRRKYDKDDLAPVQTDKSCMFKLGAGQVELILQKGSFRTSKFKDVCFLNDKGHVRCGNGGPTPEQVAKFAAKYGKKSPYLLVGLGVFVTDRSFGFAKSGVNPQVGGDGLCEVTVTTSELFLEESDFLRAKQLLRRSDWELVSQVFYEIADARPDAYKVNPLPGRIEAALAVCIRAWGRVEPGDGLSNEYAAIETELIGITKEVEALGDNSAKNVVKFSKDLIAGLRTLCAFTVGYDPNNKERGDHVDGPSDERVMLTKGNSGVLGEEVRMSALMVLVDAWDKYFKGENIWDDHNKVFDKGKLKKIMNDTQLGDLLAASVTSRLTKPIYTLLRDTRPWQS